MVTQSDLRELSRAYLLGRDHASSQTVRDMVRHEARRIDRAFDKLARHIQIIFTYRDPYPDFEALRQDVLVNRRMFVFQGFSETPLWDPQLNWKARAVHDWDHIAHSADFSIEGEARAYRHAAARMPGLAPLYLSEIVLQAAVQQYTGEFAEQKLVLPSPHVARIANSLKDAADRRRQAPAAMVWYAAGMLKAMSLPALMVHLGAAGYPFETAVVIADAAQMLNQRRA